MAMKEVAHVPQISKPGASTSDGLMSYPGQSLFGVACGVIVIFVGNGHGDMISNPE